MKEKVSKIKIKKMKNESVKVSFRVKLVEKQTNIDETEQNKMEFMWWYLKNAKDEATKYVCGTVRKGLDEEEQSDGTKI